MSFEQKINYQLNKHPVIKKIVKSAYQRVMCVISPKINSEGNITRISPNDSSHEFFFGYYDKSPWDITDHYMLCVRANDTWSDVSPKEIADILLIDTQKSESDSARVKKIAETRAWNVQQACMLQWLGPDYSSRVLYNDYRDGKYVSVILTIATMKEKVISAPVYSVSADGKYALTLDFSRLYNLRPGYGYYNVTEKTKGVALPDETAIWKVDLETGEVTDLLKYTDFANFHPRPEMQETGAVHKVNHLMLSPNGKRCMVLYRWFIGPRKYTRLVTFDGENGGNMYVLSDDDMVSHCFWKDDEHILAFENKRDGGPGYYLMTDKTQKYIHCWPQLSNDGHPSYSPDRKLVVTDSYPDRARVASINLMDGDENKTTNTTIARVFAPFKYDNDTRCDLHPRWNHKGDKVCFDSAFEGHRGLYIVDVAEYREPCAINRDEYEEEPLISVIIPVYNVERYLKRCVDSVINQTYRNLEIILVDDGSTDSSGILCDQLKEFDPRITVIHKKNGGLGSARNAGIKVAHGTYVAFLDSDDWVTTDCYEYMLNLAVTNKANLSDIMVYQVRSEKDMIPETSNKIEVYKGRDILEHYMHRGMCEQHGAPYSVCRKLYEIDLFNDDTATFVEGTVNEDICFNYRILRKCQKIAVSQQIKYFYFQGDTSITTGTVEQKDFDLLAISKDLVELAEESGDTKIIELAKMKEARSDFSLLTRVALYGIEIENWKKITSTMLKRLRGNYRLLIKSPMPASRKILATGYVINYRITSNLMKVISKARQ